MPPGQLVHEPPPDSDPTSDSESTDEEDDREEEEGLEGTCYFSEYGEAEDGDSEKPEGVYEVTPKLDSRGGSTTPTKPRPVPAPNLLLNVRASSVLQELPEAVQEQETKVAVRGHPGQGGCGEAECDRHYG